MTILPKLTNSNDLQIRDVKEVEYQEMTLNHIL